MIYVVKKHVSLLTSIFPLVYSNIICNIDDIVMLMAKSANSHARGFDCCLVMTESGDVGYLYADEIMLVDSVQ